MSKKCCDGDCNQGDGCPDWEPADTFDGAMYVGAIIVLCTMAALAFVIWGRP